MSPVCVECQREMFCAKTGRVLEVRVVDDGGGERPYQLWRADEFACRSCGSAVMIAAREAWLDAGVKPEEFDAATRAAKADNNLRLVRVR